MVEKPPNGRSREGYHIDFQGNSSLESLAFYYVLHDGIVSFRVVEDVVDPGDTGSRVVLLGEVVEIHPGLGLDESVLIAVLDETSGFARYPVGPGRTRGWHRVNVSNHVRPWPCGEVDPQPLWANGTSRSFGA